MNERLFSINTNGDLTNIGRPFCSYEWATVKQAGIMFQTQVKLVEFEARRLNGDRFLTNTVSVFVYPSRSGIDSLRRLMRIADADEIKGHVWILIDPYSVILLATTSLTKAEAKLAELEDDEVDLELVELE